MPPSDEPMPSAPSAPAPSTPAPSTPAPSSPGAPSDELRVRRKPERSSHDRETIDAIIDAALIAHVGTVRDGAPVVIPVLAARDGDWLLIHGAPATGTVRRGRSQPVCVSMALLDGLVLARSGFHHSLNYRSVVIFGDAENISDEAERARALDVLVDRLVPGRAAELRPMTSAELRQTAVMRISLERASAKVRSGPPSDDPEDYELPIWAGVVPVAMQLGKAEPDPLLAPGIPVPQNVHDLADTQR